MLQGANLNNAGVEINDLNGCIVWLDFYSHSQMIVFKYESFQKNTKRGVGWTKLFKQIFLVDIE